MTIQLKETRNWRLLWRVCLKPEILPNIFDDRFEVFPDKHQKMRAKIRSIISNPNNHTFAVRYESKFAGCFVLYALGKGEFEVHTLLEKNFHGLIAIRIGRFSIQFVLGLPFVSKLSSYCPDNMPHTYLFARMCGFKKVGIHPMKWIVKGVEYAMQAVEIKKEDVCHYC